jgi:RsbT co-antagonist protein rsbRD N-terminal domain
LQQAFINSESVASILERDGEITIQNWLEMVEQSAELTRIPLSRHERIGHLPELFRDLIDRLRLGRASATPISLAARDHGEIRRQQGYTAPMVVEESRFLQVSIFETLHRNLSSMEFSRVLPDIVTIADECDSQLKQAMLSYGPAR